MNPATYGNMGGMANPFAGFIPAMPAAPAAR